MELQARLERLVAGPWLEGVEVGDCWLWLGRWRSRYGYGRIRAGGWNSEQLQAHRAMYELLVGPLPEGSWARHSCDNPLCCNPAHIEPGSARDNLLDQYRRGRRRSA